MPHRHWTLPEPTARHGAHPAATQDQNVTMTDRFKRLFPGTVDLLILKTLTRGPMHGFEISRSLRAGSNDLIVLKDAALYQALHRIRRKGWIEGEWGISDARKRARFYRLTEAGRKRLEAEEQRFRRYADAVLHILEAPTP